MKLGITSNRNNKSIDNYIEDFKLLKEAGFDSIDLQSFVDGNNILYKLNDDEFIILLESVKEEASKQELVINQLHTYWEFPPTKDYTNEDREDELKYYIRSIEGAKILNTKYVVIHHRFPFGLDENVNKEKEEEFFKINVDFLLKLEKYARDNNVILCLENLPMNMKYCTVDGTLKIINAINSEYIKMCLDIGHANVFNDDIYEDIIKINDKLACLHVHDNLHGKDSHMYPYQGSVNWNNVMKGLKEINYNGVFSFETAPSATLEYETRLLGLKYLFSIGRELINI